MYVINASQLFQIIINFNILILLKFVCYLVDFINNLLISNANINIVQFIYKIHLNVNNVFKVIN
jgi:hypothetical protein